ncbi:uncharacterized protein CTRU02_201591 [Colletotrichum truncatum]|uniref:Uncharacterized protein n=1 Tax=Colletotrichum truncatum TaxID=5467 RepID=A0ACC3ZHY7_COLTU
MMLVGKAAVYSTSEREPAFGVLTLGMNTLKLTSSVLTSQRPSRSLSRQTSNLRLTTWITNGSIPDPSTTSISAACLAVFATGPNYSRNATTTSNREASSSSKKQNSTFLAPTAPPSAAHSTSASPTSPPPSKFSAALSFPSTNSRLSSRKPASSRSPTAASSGLSTAGRVTRTSRNSALGRARIWHVTRLA